MTSREVIDAIKLAEEFYSIQGEGQLTGTPMYFIRFSGCSVGQCPVRMHCDTDYSYKYRGFADAVALRAKEQVGNVGWICITGGEPLDQPKALNSLIKELKDNRVMIQTSGAKALQVEYFMIKGGYLVVSPKTSPKECKITRASELKLVYTGQHIEEIREWERTVYANNVFLMPEWKNGKCNAEDTVAMVKKLQSGNGRDWKLCMQMHKFADVR